MPFRDVLGQDLAIEILRRGLARGRLHHALLFVGPEGVGKELAAFGLACAVTCEREPGEGCGTCPTCHRVLSISSEGAAVPLHPDVVVVERGLYSKEIIGKDEKTDISVDQIRRVVLEKINFGPHEARERIVIIRRAEEMNAGAANALLKTLEEPPGHTRFVLLTSRPGELLPTIRSRTQPIRFSLLRDDVVEKILIARGVEPALAKQSAELAGGSVEVADALADPAQSEERTRAVEALRRASQGPLHEALEVTSSYGNSGEDRRLLAEHLTALQASDAIELRRLVLAAAADPRPETEARIDVALARFATARAVEATLDRNANVPLALESGWLKLRKST
jgi:DNA polymerase-3 subunit delta'